MSDARAAVLPVSPSLPRRGPVFLLSSAWTFVALIGVLVIVVGGITPVSLLVGLLLFVPSVALLARPARVADGSLPEGRIS